jgi:hypothetical protein
MSTLIIDDYSPIYVGDTGNPYAPTFRHKEDSPVDLTGATLALKMQDEGGNVKTCAGTWTIDDAQNGVAHYAWQSADVNSAGIWQLFVTITIGGKPVHADVKTLEIKAVPA